MAKKFSNEMEIGVYYVGILDNTHIRDTVLRPSS